MAKRILIDGRNLGLEKGTGVATYARNLSYSLHDLGYQVEVLYGGRAAPGQSDLMKEIAFFDTNAGDIPKLLQILRSLKEAMIAPFGYEATKVPITGTVIKDTFSSRLPYYDAIYNSPDLFRKAHELYGIFDKLNKVNFNPKPDIVHWTYPLPLQIKGIPNLYTLHDLVPLRLPYTTLDNKRRYLKLVRALSKKADHIITVSESAKTDIVNLLNIHPDRVTNTYQSVSIPDKYANKSPETVQREVEGTFGLEYKGYFIFWGSIEPKKNIGRIIEGYLASNVKTPLVIVGAQAWKSEEELKLLNNDSINWIFVNDKGEMRHKSKVIQLSYVPFPLLVSLVKGAKATIFPSLYEGFGLPVLESMLLGTPVITSNTASIPEVAGEAARLVNPYDSRQIAEAIRDFEGDSSLREHYSRLGFEQAAKFSEASYQNALSTVYSKFI